MKYILVLLAMLGLAACGGSSDNATRGLSDDYGLAAHVPADSAFLFASFDGLPEALAAQLQSSRQSNWLDGVSGADESGELVDLGQLWMSGEFRSSIGIDEQPRFAFYEANGVPVLRVATRDPAAARAWFDERSASDPTAVAKLTDADSSWRLGGAEDGPVVVMIAGQHIVAVMSPVDSAAASPAIPAAPRDNLAERLAALLKRHALESSFIAFVDTQAVVRSVMPDAETLETRPLLAAKGVRPADSVCRDETLRLAAMMPTIFGAVSRADSKALGFKTVFELRPDLAQGLSRLEQPVPGLGASNDRAMTLGFSADLSVLRDFVSDRVAAIQDQPFSCDSLLGLNDAADRAARLMQRQPLPPTARDFRGVLLAVDDVGQLSSDPGQMRDAGIAALLAVDDAPSVMALANLFVPDVAALGLQPDGEVKALKGEMLQAFAATPWLGMSKDQIVFANGVNAERRARELFDLRPNEDAPLFYIDVDLSSNVEAVRNIVANRSATSELDETLAEYRELYDRWTLRMTTTDAGIEVDILQTLK